MACGIGIRTLARISTGGGCTERMRLPRSSCAVRPARAEEPVRLAECGVERSDPGELLGDACRLEIGGVRGADGLVA